MEIIKIGFLALAAYLLSSFAMAATPTPIPRPAQQEKVTPDSQQMPTNQISTTNIAKSPLYVKADCDKGCGHVEDNKGWWQKLSTDPVASFTALLFFSTLLLWNATNRSVKVAERALTELERPYIVVQPPLPPFNRISSRLDTNQGGQTTYTLGKNKEFEVIISNFGRTPASLKRFEYALSSAPHGGIVDPIDPIQIGGRELPVGCASDRDVPYRENVSTEGIFSPEDVAEIAYFERSIWFIGFVRYEDIFLRTYVDGFAFVYDLKNQRFIRRGSAIYNYSRSEKAKKIPPPSSQG